MKKILMICSIVFIPFAGNSVTTGVLRTACPSGYTTITKSVYKYMNNICQMPYNCLANEIYPCTVSSPNSTCYLYIAPNTSFSDTYGTYNYGTFNICPLDGDVIKCVKNSSPSVCTNRSGIQYYNRFTATCYGNSVVGIAACSQDTGNRTTGSTALDTLTYSSSGNKWCWCRMVKPAVSKWVLGSEYLTPDDCNRDCSGLCAYALGSTSSTQYQNFRQKLFQNLQ